jgi:LuxR family maltose regulon positive regulatory protein
MTVQVTGGAAIDPVASVPGFAVDRPGLVERLEWGMRKRVVLVVAPAGYGKSVLLAQWAEAHPHRRVVWTEARSTDDAPAFGRRLVDALDRVTPGAAGRAGAFLGAVPGALGESVLAAVAAELAALAPVVLVIEDLEELSSPELRRELAALAERVPDEVTFVWASRDDRFPGIEPLRVRDEVVEIRQAALALSCDEGAAVVARMGGPVLDPAAAVALHTRTEGWPAGVQLAALGLRDHDDPGGFIADFAGDDRHVADYLSGEVLAQQSPELTDFLLRTAVLDRLSGPLCDVVTGRDDSQRTLEHLDGQSLFLRPLDRRRERFTYHPLFRDLLRYELRAARPGAETALLHRAATWHLDRGESEAAAEYLVRAADWPGVIALAAAEGATYFAQSRPSTVIRWLEQVPPDRLLADTDAIMALAGLLTMSGRTLAAQDLVERLEQSRDLNVVQQTEAACLRACWTMHHAPPEEIVGPMAFIAGLTDEAMERPGGPLLGVFSPAAMRALTTGCAAVVHSQQADYGRARDISARRWPTPTARSPWPTRPGWPSTRVRPWPIWPPPGPTASGARRPTSITSRRDSPAGG